MTSYSSPMTDAPPPERDGPAAGPQGDTESRPAAVTSPGSENAPMVEAHGLTKRFGEFVAVDGVDFTIEAGESFGFLGPNGAGKTSTMRMISCISPVSGGTLRVLGRDPALEGAL